jgi:hypothetical protein
MREGGGLAAMTHAELPQQVGNLCAGGAPRDEERVGDLRAAVTARFPRNASHAPPPTAWPRLRPGADPAPPAWRRTGHLGRGSITCTLAFWPIRAQMQRDHVP